MPAKPKDALALVMDAKPTAKGLTTVSKKALEEAQVLFQQGKKRAQVTAKNHREQIQEFGSQAIGRGERGLTLMLAGLQEGYKPGLTEVGGNGVEGAGYDMKAPVGFMGEAAGTLMSVFGVKGGCHVRNLSEGITNAWLFKAAKRAGEKLAQPQPQPQPAVQGLETAHGPQIDDRAVRLSPRGQDRRVPPRGNGQPQRRQAQRLRA